MTATIVDLGFADELDQWDYVRQSVADDITARFGDVDIALLDLTSPFDQRRLTDAVLAVIDNAMENHP